jgi:MAF protein
VSRFQEKVRHRNPDLLALYNACGKAKAVSRHYRNAVIIGVDTIGVLNGKILGKPANRGEAASMLRKLSGKTHRVISGLCVIDTATGKRMTETVVTKVTFRKITEGELEKYLDSGQWKGKAGSYAIQGRAKKFVKRIDGDRANVVGLPVFALKDILLKMQLF